MWRQPLLDVLSAMRRFAVRALLPPALGAIVTPLLVAVLPPLRQVAAEILPAGAERLMVLATAGALGAEIVRAHVERIGFRRRLRVAEAELARLTQEGL
jgi:hypothetical protein